MCDGVHASVYPAGGAAQQGLEAPVHDLMGDQRNALRSGGNEVVILPGCADLEVSAMHAASRTNGAGSKTTRARNG
jgi:hypothetical protein